MLQILLTLTLSTTFNVVRKEKDMFDTIYYTIYDSLFERLVSSTAGGGIFLQSYSINVKMLKCFFIQCKTSSSFYGLARPENSESTPICSGGGVFIEANILILSKTSFQKCTGKYLGCSIYSNAKSKLEMSYVLCCSSYSIDDKCNDITIEDGNSNGVSHIDGSYINITDSSLNQNPAGALNVGLFPGSFKLNYICISFAENEILSGFVLSTKTAVSTKVSNIYIENANVKVGLFYAYSSNIELSNFNAVNSKGNFLKKKDGDLATITVVDSLVSCMSLEGCQESKNVDSNEGKYIEYFTRFDYIADQITCAHGAWLAVLNLASTILEASFD